jgi:hypothetical protein
MGISIILIIVVIIVCLFFGLDFLASKSIENHFKNKQNVNVSTNEIYYPSQVICDKCNINVFPTRRSIDSSTWDLKCSCGNIAYKHPKREERIEQIKNLLN